MNTQTQKDKEVKFGEFEYNIPYTNWEDFKYNISNAKKKGFSNIEELISIMGMDINFYEKIRENMIFNWKESVSKSLLNAIQYIDKNFPEKGQPIFKNLRSQTKFLIIMSSGQRHTNIFGSVNHTEGLGYLSRFKNIKQIRLKESYLNEFGRMERFVKVGDQPALTVTETEAIEKVNTVLKYVWLYVFYNNFLLKKKLSEKTVKLPKYIYRGVRINNLHTNPHLRQQLLDLNGKGENHRDTTKRKIDFIIDLLNTKGINQMVEEKYVSFTASKDIAEYFSNNEGFVIRVKTKDVDVISSELTEEFFDQNDYVSGKKEREYIVKISDEYKIKKEDVVVTNVDYLISDNNPMAVKRFDHDNKNAYYNFKYQNKIYNVKAFYCWITNTKGRIMFTVKDGDNTLGYGESGSYFKKEYGFNPMPTLNNLSQISQFKIEVKSRW